jgi:hypothetical protein
VSELLYKARVSGSVYKYGHDGCGGAMGQMVFGIPETMAYEPWAMHGQTELENS